jgi:beta-glucosidase
LQAAALMAALLSIAMSTSAQQAGKQRVTGPWMNTRLSPDERADLVMKEMTLDEKISLVHGMGGFEAAGPVWNGGAGTVAAIPRLGLPYLHLADSAVGVREAAKKGRYSTLLPSALAAAASWDADAAFQYGALIGRELRDQLYNTTLGGGVDITREPRNGRNFEYAGEDPILAGKTIARLIQGINSQQILSDVKHYAFNDQETGRDIGNVILDKRAMRETDLLAFEIAVAEGKPGMVMCSYNKLNGDWACENDYLLNEVLKKDWKFPGFVVSDWEATHTTTKAALAGLDNEQPGYRFFGDALKRAVTGGEVPMSRLDDMVHRIVRSEFAAGIVDDPPTGRVVDPFTGAEISQHIAEESIVLLQNKNDVLPLNPARYRSIALIGSHADASVLSGGGSAQVDPPGGPPSRFLGPPVWFPSSPLKYIHLHAPEAALPYNDGSDPAAAATLARQSELAIVFVNQPMTEARDARSLSLPDNQDALVAAVAHANPHTIVVLETGGPVSMPWADSVEAIVEAWYPGVNGAQALANLLYGAVNPSAKLPVTFAKRDADLPHPKVPGIDLKLVDGRHLPPFDIHYTEGLKVGYKWFDAEEKQPLFPFGFGLSYTKFAYSNLTASMDTVTLAVRNTGERDGVEVAQVYAVLPKEAEEPPKRLVAWARVPLAAGESKTITLKIDPKFLSIFNVGKNDWELLPGKYEFLAGASSRDLPLRATVTR